MKKSILILAMSILSGISLLFSSAAVAQTMSREEVKNQVIDVVTYPQDAIDKHLEGDVLVSFSTSKDGKIQVQEIFSRVPELQEYVLNKLNAFELPQAQYDVTAPIMLKFTFKLI